MSYASTVQAQGLIPVTISSTTRPTSTQLTSFIELTSAEIDSALSARGLTVPVTTPAWWVDYLEHINALGAAAYTMAMAFPQESGPGGVAEGPVLMRLYEQKIEQLRSGIGIPAGVAISEAITAPKSYFLDTGSIGEDVDAEDDWGEPVDSAPAFTSGRRF